MKLNLNDRINFLVIAKSYRFEQLIQDKEMNTVYYLVGTLDANIKGLAVTGGHGYTYDPEVVGRKKVSKNVPTPYGYYVDSDHQNSSVNIELYLSGRSIGYESPNESIIVQLEKLFNWHFSNGGKKILIPTNVYDGIKKFTENVPMPGVDEELQKRVYALYEQNKNNIIFNFILYPKGGLGVKHASDQRNLSAILGPLTAEPCCVLDIADEKDFSDPEISFNKLVTGSHWYFNTGDASTYYTLTKNERRAYYFGQVETDKNYFGKATPDVYYSALYTKSPITILDKLFNYCKLVMKNPLNHLLAGNLNNIKSKEVARTIDSLPGTFKGNELISPMKIGMNETPCLVEVLNPAGLAYRIKDKIDDTNTLYDYFLRRENDWFGKTNFLDITKYFFIQEGKKLKLSPEFSSNTLKFSIPVASPSCNKPVKVNLSIRYDCPGRNSFAWLIKEKITEIKVYLALDFSNPAGVSYATITSCPNFDYVHTNSISNLRVYNLRELGRN